MKEYGDTNAKYCVMVSTVAYASKCAGMVYCDNIEDLQSVIDDNYEDLLEEGYFSVNISNDFEVGDIDLEVSIKESDLEYYLNNTSKGG